MVGTSPEILLNEHAWHFRELWINFAFGAFVYIIIKGNEYLLNGFTPNSDSGISGIILITNDNPLHLSKLTLPIISYRIFSHTWQRHQVVHFEIVSVFFFNNCEDLICSHSEPPETIQSVSTCYPNTIIHKGWHNQIFVTYPRSVF